MNLFYHTGCFFTKRMCIVHSLLFFLFLVSSSRAVDYRRTFTPDSLVYTGDTLWVFLRVQNTTADTLKGLVCSEQIPGDVSVVHSGVWFNGRLYYDLLQETGESNEVYGGYVPYRWVFQNPEDQFMRRALDPGDYVEILYGITTSAETTIELNKDGWYGGLYNDTLKAPVFGFDSTNNAVIRFIEEVTYYPPEIIHLPDTMRLRENSTAVLNMDVYASDPDTPDSLLSWEMEVRQSGVLLNYTEEGNTLEIIPDGFIGETQLYFTLRDEKDNTASDSLILVISNATEMNQEQGNIPDRVELMQNYPNPFNPKTIIHYNLSKASFVTLELFDCKGSKIRNIFEGFQKAGTYKRSLNAGDLPSGIYYCRLFASGYRSVRKLVYIK